MRNFTNFTMIIWQFNPYSSPKSHLMINWYSIDIHWISELLELIRSILFLSELIPIRNQSIWTQNEINHPKNRNSWLNNQSTPILDWQEFNTDNIVMGYFHFFFISIDYMKNSIEFNYLNFVQIHQIQLYINCNNEFQYLYIISNERRSQWIFLQTSIHHQIIPISSLNNKDLDRWFI